MKTSLEQEDIQSVASAVVEMIKPMLSNNGKHDRYLTTKELAKYLGLAPSTIANNKKYLPHTYLNSTPLFKKSEIDAYLDQYRVKPKEKKKKQKFADIFSGGR